MTPKTGNFFEINCQFFLSLREVVKEYAAAKNFISIMNLNAPVTPQSYAGHTYSMSNDC